MDEDTLLSSLSSTPSPTRPPRPSLPPTIIFCNNIQSCRSLDFLLNEEGFSIA